VCHGCHNPLLEFGMEGVNCDGFRAILRANRWVDRPMTGLSNWGLAFVFNKMTHPPGGGKSVCGRK
jgi:hypothetical protein